MNIENNRSNPSCISKPVKKFVFCLHQELFRLTMRRYLHYNFYNFHSAQHPTAVPQQSLKEMATT